MSRDSLATVSRQSRDSLATFPRLRAPLQALLQAFYRALELQVLCCAVRYRQTHRLTDRQIPVCPSVCVSVCNALHNTETAVLAPYRRLVGGAVLWECLATVSRQSRDSLATFPCPPGSAVPSQILEQILHAQRERKCTSITAKN